MISKRQLLAGLAASPFLGRRAWAQALRAEVERLLEE